MCMCRAFYCLIDNNISPAKEPREKYIHIQFTYMYIVCKKLDIAPSFSGEEFVLVQKKHCNSGTVTDGVTDVQGVH